MDGSLVMRNKLLVDLNSKYFTVTAKLNICIGLPVNLAEAAP